MQTVLDGALPHGDVSNKLWRWGRGSEPTCTSLRCVLWPVIKPHSQLENWPTQNILNLELCYIFLIHFVPFGLRGVLLQGGCPLLRGTGRASADSTHSSWWAGEQEMLERSSISARSGKQLIKKKIPKHRAQTQPKEDFIFNDLRLIRVHTEK